MSPEILVTSICSLSTWMTKFEALAPARAAASVTSRVVDVVLVTAMQRRGVDGVRLEDQRVHAGPADDHIRLLAGGAELELEGVVAGTAVEGVQAGARGQVVAVTAGPQHVLAGAGHQRILAVGIAVDHVGAGAGDEEVAARIVVVAGRRPDCRFCSAGRSWPSPPKSVSLPDPP